MQTRIAVLAILLLSLLLAGCAFDIVTGSGIVVTETREVRNFDAIDLSGSGQVVVTQGETETLTVEAEDNIIPLVRSEVRSGTLYLGLQPGSRIVNMTRPLRFHVTLKDLRALQVSGSGNLQSASIDTDQLNVGVSGSGTVRIDGLTAGAVSIDISGSGGVELAGEVNRQTVEISGSGSYTAGDLKGEGATVRISGSGSATLWVTNSLSSNVSGSGSVRYYGTPERIDQRVSGSGRIRGLGEK